MSRHRAEPVEAEAVQPYPIRVKPNWVARLSLASVVLLLLFFSISQYRTSQSNATLLRQAVDDKRTADVDRRSTQDLAAAALADRTKATHDRDLAIEQTRELINIVLSLENQVVDLGGVPVIPKNSVLDASGARRKPGSTSTSPSAFEIPRHTPAPAAIAAPHSSTARSSAPRSSTGSASAPASRPAPTPRPTSRPAPAPSTSTPRPSTSPPPTSLPTSTPRPSTSTTPPVVTLSTPTVRLPTLPLPLPTPTLRICLPPLLCVN